MLGSRLLPSLALLLGKNEETKGIVVTRLPLVVLWLALVLLVPVLPPPVADASLSFEYDADNKWDDSATTNLAEVVAFFVFAPFVVVFVFLDIVVVVVVSVKARRPEQSDDDCPRLFLVSKAGAPAAPTKGNGGTRPVTREIQMPSRRTTRQTTTTTIAARRRRRRRRWWW